MVYNEDNKETFTTKLHLFRNNGLHIVFMTVSSEMKMSGVSNSW